MKGHVWEVKDKITGESFSYKRYSCGNYYMKVLGESRFSRVKREELFKSLAKAHVRL